MMDELINEVTRYVKGFEEIIDKCDTLECKHDDIQYLYKIKDYYRCEKCKTNFKPKIKDVK